MDKESIKSGLGGVVALERVVCAEVREEAAQETKRPTDRRNGTGNQKREDEGNDVMAGHKDVDLQLRSGQYKRRQTAKSAVLNAQRSN